MTPPFSPHHVDRLVATVMCQFAGVSERAECRMQRKGAWTGDEKFPLRAKAWLQGIDGRAVHLHGCPLFDLRVSE